MRSALVLKAQLITHNPAMWKHVFFKKRSDHSGVTARLAGLSELYLLEY